MGLKLVNHPDRGTGWACGAAGESPATRAAWDELLAQQAQQASPRPDDPARG